MAKKPIDLTKKKPRDTSGASSGNRFSYQVNWAFLKLIELHKTKNEYLIILDLHDDVVIGNSETAPAIIDFYQVKTSKTKPWSETRLFQRKKSKNQVTFSIIGKLWEHQVNFPQNTGVLAFVSNRHCGLEMPAKLQEKERILFSQLEAACKARLVAQIKKEHALVADPDCDKQLVFILSPLRIDSHAADVKGVLTEYCEQLVPSGDYKVSQLYRVVADELRKQNDSEAQPTSMPELLSKKAIVRSRVQKILDDMLPSDQYAQIWNSIQREDFGSGIKLGGRQSIHEGFTRYAAHRQSRTNKVAMKVRKSIQRELARIDRGAIDTYEQLFSQIVPNLTGLPSTADANYLKGAIILEWNDHGTRQLPTTDPKSQGEAA